MTTLERNKAIKRLLEKKAPANMPQAKRIALAKSRLKKSGIYTPTGQLKKHYK